MSSDLVYCSPAALRRRGPEPLAVEVTNLRLSYGSTKSGRNHAILNDLNMQVPRGSIYGLLGPSGCGKTSLIRCLIGSVRHASGSVTVFGRKPGSPGCNIPGRDVGYMPQDISLYHELSIAETLRYFATLYNMPADITQKRVAFLVQFLALPDQHRLVGVLSGGQKRRVSLATALIHRPPLLLLDEPTVGVDPLLRQSIWAHLIELSTTERLTVLITTHYIEEARGANLVGLMRHGQILVQDRPNSLLDRYQLDTLEDVFLKLCNDRHLPNDEEDDGETGTESVDDGLSDDVELANTSSFKKRSKSDDDGSSGVTSGDEEDCSFDTVVLEEVKSSIADDSHELVSSKTPTPGARGSSRSGVTYLKQTGAIIRKNFVALRRTPGYLLFQFLLPTIEVVLFCACIGRNIHNIPVAIYNGDNQSSVTVDILAQLDPYTIDQLHCDSYDLALAAVRDGRAASAITIQPNFTESLNDRLMLLGNVDDETLNRSTIHIFPDMSNQIMALTVYEKVIDAFHHVARKYLHEMGTSTALLDFPINFSTPIYGSHDSTFTEFMAPGVLLSIAFLAAIPLTAMTIVLERKSGLIERTVVAGISHFQLLLSHLITQFFVLLVQVFLLMLCVFPIFQIPYHGEFVFILLLTILQSVCGMSFGLLVSAVAPDENTATMLALGSFYPNLLLSGTVWPTEAMSHSVRYFSYLLPQTLPIEAMRFMISRGWGPERLEVQLGFLVTLVWIAIFLLAASMVFKYRKH